MSLRFFFSSRRRHTRWPRDWSSDVCSSDLDIIASPAARKRARELNVDLGTISANDPFGRIRPEDVDAAAEGGTEEKAEKPAKKEATKAPEKTEVDKPVDGVNMSSRRQTIANRLGIVQHES